MACAWRAKFLIYASSRAGASASKMLHSAIVPGGTPWQVLGHSGCNHRREGTVGAVKRPPRAVAAHPACARS
jgi:hypothetical protein